MNLRYFTTEGFNAKSHMTKVDKCRKEAKIKKSKEKKERRKKESYD
jgi:hypothetical protein